MPEMMDSSMPNVNAVITHDTDFLGIDKYKRWAAKQKRIKERRRRRR